MEGRMTICNMSIEMGARGGMIAPDDVTYEYMKEGILPTGTDWEEAVSFGRLFHQIQMPPMTGLRCLMLRILSP
jgi:homoaconitase/3-isopropylmalate dehydratase large subunit